MTVGPARFTGTPAIVVDRNIESSPMPIDHGRHAAKNRMNPDHVSVLVRASTHHATTTHTLPR